MSLFFPSFVLVAYTQCDVFVFHHMWVHLPSAPIPRYLEAANGDAQHYAMVIGENGWKSFYSQFLGQYISGNVESVQPGGAVWGIARISRSYRVLSLYIRQCHSAYDLRKISAGVIMPRGVNGMQHTVEIACEQNCVDASFNKLVSSTLQKSSLSVLHAVPDGAYTFIIRIPWRVAAIARPVGRVRTFVSWCWHFATMAVPRMDVPIFL